MFDDTVSYSLIEVHKYVDYIPKYIYIFILILVWYDFGYVNFPDSFKIQTLSYLSKLPNYFTCLFSDKLLSI